MLKLDYQLKEKVLDYSDNVKIRYSIKRESFLVHCTLVTPSVRETIRLCLFYLAPLLLLPPPTSSLLATVKCSNFKIELFLHVIL